MNDPPDEGHSGAIRSREANEKVELRVTTTDLPTTEPMPGMRPLRALGDWIAASDPAFSRLRMASRVLLSTLINAALMAALTFLVHPLPIAAYGLAMIMSFVGATAVRDATSRAQLLTRIFAGAFASAAILIASLLAPWPAAGSVMFLVVIFVAVYIRRYGPRWFAIGMIGFMSYFIGDYLHPLPADFGWIVVPLFLALGVTHLVGAMILRDEPERDFRRALVTIDTRINLILRQLMQTDHAGAPSEPERQALLFQVRRLREAMLMAEGFIPQGEDGAPAAAGPASDLAIALYHLQIATERLVRARQVDAPPTALLQAVLDHDERTLQKERTRLKDLPAEEALATRMLLRLHRARLRLLVALGPRPSPVFSATSGLAPAGPAGAAPPRGGTASKVPAALHLPIQVTLACGIAMATGLMVSSARWYWAVIAAFIVFNNTRSRADTAIRAFNRSAGTFGGIIAGTGIAALLHDQMALSLAILPLTFFLAFYFLQVSYSLMIFFITVALALIYGLMGMFAPELLLLRLEETVIGSVAGAAVAFLVFPVRASTSVDTAYERYFGALDVLIAAARDQARGEKDVPNLLALSRVVDQNYSDLATAARPLGGPWSAVTRYGPVRQRLLVLAGCAHWARVLARGLPQAGTVDAETAERIGDLAEQVAARTAILAPMGSSFFERPQRPTIGMAPPRPLPLTDNDGPVFSLEVVKILLDRALAQLGQSVERKEAA